MRNEVLLAALVWIVTPTLISTAALAGGTRVIHTPAIYANPVRCSVVNPTSRSAEVTIRMLNEDGVVLSPLGPPLETTVVIEPGHTEALEGFAEQDTSLLIRCTVEAPTHSAKRLEVSLCAHPITVLPPDGAVACVQRR